MTVETLMGFGLPGWCVPRPEPIGWGLVGTGAIAAVFAHALHKSGAGSVEAVLSRSPERGEVFCARHGGRPAGSLEEMLADSRVRAVYVATPHPLHATAAEASLIRGRAVLCEKPMTTSPEQTERLIGLARRHGAPLVEGWMYRTHPQIARMKHLICQGEIGTVRHVRSVFGFPKPGGPTGRLIDPALGGGVIFDIGGYPLTFAMLAAQCGVGTGSPPHQPRVVSAGGEVSGRGVVLHAEGEFSMGGGVTASLAVSFTRHLGVSAVVEGERGTISLPNPFLPEGQRDGTLGEIVIQTHGGTRTERVVSPHDCFALEAIATAQLLAGGEADPVAPMVNHDESIALARASDDWRRLVTEPTVSG